MAQRLGENVGKLAVCADMTDIHLALLYALSKEMILDVDVLDPLVVHRVTPESNRQHVVDAQLHLQRCISDELSKQVHVLSLARG
jgi:hypothetical protein